MEIESLMPYMSAEQIQRIGSGSAKFTDEEMKILRERKESLQIQ